jgi:hypothetical protein
LFDTLKPNILSLKRSDWFTYPPTMTSYSDELG